MYSIRVLDQDCKMIQEIPLDHNNHNIAKAAKRFISVMGEILHTDRDSDCITIVTYEKGVLGFSI
jgi:hypothetical protein